IKKLLLNSFLFFSCLQLFAQENITQYAQFHGRYDFTMFGNTMNPSENPNGCIINTESSADLNLLPGQNVVAAYLYWSGSGGLDIADLDVELNGIPLSAERDFQAPMGSANPQLNFFGAFVDVTDIVIAAGNGTYHLSELDLTGFIHPGNNNITYCNSSTNYAGWSIVVIYEDVSLPNNNVTVYDGFIAIKTTIPYEDLEIELTGLNVIDPLGAKIGFLA